MNMGFSGAHFAHHDDGVDYWGTGIGVGKGQKEHTGEDVYR
jgi:hypothetical protein